MENNWYRGQRVDNKEWIEGYYWKHYTYTCIKSSADNGDKHYIREQKNWDWNLTSMIDVEVISHTVGQCTGLPDIDGTDIFVGHIVLRESEPYEVVYRQNTCAFELRDKYDYFTRLTVGMIKAYNIRVVGNTTENMELMEGNRR